MNNFPVPVLAKAAHRGITASGEARESKESTCELATQTLAAGNNLMETVAENGITMRIASLKVEPAAGVLIPTPKQACRECGTNIGKLNSSVDMKSCFHHSLSPDKPCADGKSPKPVEIAGRQC